LADQACGEELLKLANSNRSQPARLGRPAVAPVAKPKTEANRDAVIAAVAEALGNAYDCLRVWEAWGVGTMGEDDFVLVTEDLDRVAEIADAAIEAMRPAVAPVAVSERPWEIEGWCDAAGRCWVGEPEQDYPLDHTGDFDIWPAEWKLTDPTVFVSAARPVVLLPHWAIHLPTTPQEPHP
jgi:hypothetical protein